MIILEYTIVNHPFAVRPIDVVDPYGGLGCFLQAFGERIYTAQAKQKHFQWNILHTVQCVLTAQHIAKYQQYVMRTHMHYMSKDSAQLEML